MGIAEAEAGRQGPAGWGEKMILSLRVSLATAERVAAGAAEVDWRSERGRAERPRARSREKDSGRSKSVNSAGFVFQKAFAIHSNLLWDYYSYYREIKSWLNHRPAGGMETEEITERQIK